MGVLARYGHLMNVVTDSTPRITLGEGQHSSYPFTST